jgi:hypothetical protein
MPRATPVRRRTQDAPRDAARPPITAERRVWLTLWKERVVNALPAGTLVDLKVAVRRAVETALAPYGPEDHDAEIHDLVTALVREMTDQLTAETQAAERDLRKQKLLQCVDAWIDDVMLSHFPSDLVGAPRSPQRRCVLATLRKQIRETLATELTGDESVESVVSRMQDELSIWAVEQNPQVDRRTLLRRLAPWALTAMAGGVAAVSMSPELKTVVRKGAQGLKERLIPYKPVATSLLNYGLKQVDEWAQARAKKKAPDDAADK